MFKLFLGTGSINKKKSKKKGLKYDALKLPAITTFASGKRLNNCCLRAQNMDVYYDNHLAKKLNPVKKRYFILRGLA